MLHFFRGNHYFNTHFAAFVDIYQNIERKHLVHAPADVFSDSHVSLVHARTLGRLCLYLGQGEHLLHDDVVTVHCLLKKDTMNTNTVLHLERNSSCSAKIKIKLL